MALLFVLMCKKEPFLASTVPIYGKRALIMQPTSVLAPAKSEGSAAKEKLGGAGQMLWQI